MNRDAGKLAEQNCHLAELMARGQEERKAAAAQPVGELVLPQSAVEVDFSTEQ